MRQILVPVIGAVIAVAVLSALLADCTAGGDRSREPAGGASQRYP